MEPLFKALSFDMTPQRAVLLSGGAAALFVGSMYFAADARKEGYNRDEKRNILKRAAGAALTSAASLAVVALGKGAAGGTYLERIGLGGTLAQQLRAVATSFGLTTTLFLGVVVGRRVEDGEGFFEIFPSLRLTLLPCAGTDDDYVPFRNYLLGPATEEIVFRSCILDFMLNAGFGHAAAVGCGALNFALAHVHHLYFYLTSLRIPVLQGCTIVFANLVMHSVFALYSSFIYTRTASLPAAILAHSYCNMLGPPSFGHLSNPALSSRQKHAITAALVGGAGAFAVLAGPLTRPALFGTYAHAMAW